MHVSLYRRFRPDTFDKLVRQEHVVTILKNQIQSGDVGHAYLFCGPRGTGKTSVARIFARAINCLNPQNGSPCGVCECCKALSKDSLDVVEMDAASNNSVDDVRDLREKIEYPPVTGKYKVFIIDEVHMLSASAFNALLKTLEEPPAHAVIILATTEPYKIPATIHSRCMRLDFKLIPEEDLKEHLKRVLNEIGKPYEEEAVTAIARAGAGSDRDMLSIAERCVAYSDKLTYEAVTTALGAASFEKTAQLCDKLLAADCGGAIELAETMLSEGKQPGVLCSDLLEQLHALSIVKTCNNAEKLLSLPDSHFKLLKEIASRAEGSAILRATEIFAKTENELRYSSSQRILLETAMMRAALPEAEESLDALMERVARLEKAVAGIPMPLGGVQPDNEVKPVKKQETAFSEPPVDSFDEPPMEEPIFEEAYFSDPERETPKRTENPKPAQPQSAPITQPEKPVSAASVERPAQPEQSAQPVSAPAQGKSVSAEYAFGKFMRLLRKSSRNGVLFTMCSDLEAKFEGDTLVLYTNSPTVYRSVTREEHRGVMRETFLAAGVERFDVRLISKDNAVPNAEVQLKENFPGYPVEIK